MLVAVDLYAKSLSRLRLRVACLYLHCKISHWGEYLDTSRNIYNIYCTTYSRSDIYRKSVPLNRPESSLHS